MEYEKGKILLIRHAQTPANTIGRQIGYTKDTDILTSEGIHACRRLAEYLQERYAAVFESTTIYVHRSDTNRTLETMKYTLGHLE